MMDESDDETLLQAAIQVEEYMARAVSKNIKDMPDEILQQIISHLPMLELRFFVSRVSKKFHQIIEDPEFLKWKKLYYEYRCTEQPGVKEKVNTLLDECCLAALDNGLTACFVAVHKIFRQDKTFEQRQEFIDRISSHVHYAAAKKYTESVLGPLLMQRPSVWVYVSVISVLSESVTEICKLFQLITETPSMHGTHAGQVTECFYFLAIMFLAARKKFFISPLAHYKIFSAISWCENLSYRRAVSLDSDIQLTFEQKRIVSCDLQPNDSIKILALAGTGKTTTLRKLCEAHPRKKFLVLMFNKDTAEEAKRSFPTRYNPTTTIINTVCQTFNSLAYKHIIQQNPDGDQFGFLVPDLRMGKICGFLPGVKGYSHFLRSKDVATTLSSFLQSEDRIILDTHLPAFDSESYKTVAKNVWEKQIISDTMSVWDEMRCPVNSKGTKIRGKGRLSHLGNARIGEKKRIPITHDGCAKLFQLMDYINFMKGYDVLCVDEAQDLNPVMVEPLMRQQCPKILVGDEHQQIYAFRGAVNTLKFGSTRTFSLTRSFRFGWELGYLATCWLEGAKKENKKLLVGVPDKLGFLDGHVPAGVPVTVIARKNETIFEFCFDCVKVKVTQENGCAPTKLHLIGGCDNFLKLDKLKSIDKLLCRVAFDENDDHLISKFSTIADLQKYAEKYNDHELLGLIRVMMRHPLGKVLEWCNKIKQQHVNDMNIADYVLTTVHKSKGMEFQVVMIADDFPDFQPLQLESHMTRSDVEKLGQEKVNELNMMYVAMTRAKSSLIINNSLLQFLKSTMKESLEQCLNFESASKGISVDNSTVCTECLKEFTAEQKDGIILKRRKLAVMFSKQMGIMSDGLICATCATTVGSLKYKYKSKNDPPETVAKFGSDTPGTISKSTDYNRRFFAPLYLREKNEI